MGGSVLRRHEIDSFLYFSTWFIFIPGSYLGSTQTLIIPGSNPVFHAIFTCVNLSSSFSPHSVLLITITPTG